MNISPWAPRGVYFNDNVYIGYVSDESQILEIGAVDPDDGGLGSVGRPNPRPAC